MDLRKVSCFIGIGARFMRIHVHGDLINFSNKDLKIRAWIHCFWIIIFIIVVIIIIIIIILTGLFNLLGKNVIKLSSFQLMIFILTHLPFVFHKYIWSYQKYSLHTLFLALCFNLKPPYTSNLRKPTFLTPWYAHVRVCIRG